jgi:catechol 2,3-dioxygenase-like lactoylglutathione lyase family enzyme
MALADAKVEAAIAVSDMDRARQFYEGKLGLSGGSDEEDGGHTYRCGEGSEIHVFPSESAGGSGATLAAWAVGDLEAEVGELTSNGVSFEQYGDPLNTDDRGIANLPGGRVAWFKDPDGNVLGLFER